MAGSRMWVFTQGKLKCCAGPPDTCHRAEFVEVDDSAFFTEELRAATRRINATLDKISGAAPEGTHLAIIETPDGLLLAWAEFDDELLADAVTSNSDPDKIVATLGLP